MKIGIDASLITSNNKTGVENYVLEICKRIGFIDTENQYVLYFNSKSKPNIEFPQNVTVKCIPFPKYWHTFRLPLSLLTDKPDVFISLSNFLPLFSPKKTIVTIHDLAVKYYPHAYSFSQKLRLNLFHWHTVKKATKIITVSKSTKTDLLIFYPRSKDKTEVIYPSINSEVFFKSNQVERPDFCPYFLVSGRIERRKNSANIIDAFALFKEKNKTDHKLVFAGNSGYGFKEIEKKIKQKDIIQVGHQKPEDLANLYHFADCLIYPSLYEGFGMPILESMACGTPVITSSDKWAIEVAGDSALLIDPGNIESISKAMEKLSLDHFIHDKYVKLGYQNINRFSWDRNVKQLVEVIKSL